MIAEHARTRTQIDQTVRAITLGGERSDRETVMQSRVQRAVSPEPQPLLEVGQADQDDRQQSAAIPSVVEQDVQMVERVLVQQVGLVDEQDGQESLLGELLDMGADGPEHVAAGGSARQPQGEAELAIEIAPPQSDVVAVGQSETLLGQRMAQRPQHARLSDARLADERDALARLGGVDQLVEQGLLARG
jgi:hypothetical protein